MGNAVAAAKAAKLQPIVEQRREKMKDEMIGKSKPQSARVRPPPPLHPHHFPSSEQDWGWDVHPFACHLALQYDIVTLSVAHSQSVGKCTGPS